LTLSRSLNDGEPKQAIIEAGAVRTSILLTTGAVVIGASIILFDPLFQGLAISVFGAIVSTILTLIVVPLIYYVTERKWESSQGPSEEEM
jgi:multidrug efflux pump subunit AcrB